MSLKSVDHAVGKIRAELRADEKIIWSGAPNRTMMYKRFKGFVYRNTAFFLIIASLIGATVWQEPQYSRQIIIGLSLIALVRAFGILMVWPGRVSRHHMAYALTNKRLISVNGRTGATSSWFSPAIDRMRIRKSGKLATFQLQDTELGFGMTMYHVPEPDKLRVLLLPYTADLSTISPDPVSPPRKSRQKPQTLARPEAPNKVAA